MLAVDRAIHGRVNTATAALVVRVGDVEDQPPQFIQAPPVTRIPEDIPVNSGVLEGECPGLFLEPSRFLRKVRGARESFERQTDDRYIGESFEKVINMEGENIRS